MYELRIQSSFSAAHRLRNYKGKCEKVHGHNWIVYVTISTPKLDKIGLAMDFIDLKRITNDVLAKLDHSYLNEIPPFDKTNPSSENIAKWLYKTLKEKLSKFKTITLSRIDVAESDTSRASYYEEKR